MLRDHRHGLVANVCVTPATGTAERDAADLLLDASALAGRTVGGDKNFDVAAFVAAVRALAITPHVAQKAVGTAIDGRTTRHAGYASSQRKRTRIEQVFGWMKTVGGLRKLRHRDGELVDWIVTFTAAGVQPDSPAHTLGEGDVSGTGLPRARAMTLSRTRSAPPTNIDDGGEGNGLTSYFFIGLLGHTKFAEAFREVKMGFNPC